MEGEGGRENGKKKLGGGREGEREEEGEREARRRKVFSTDFVQL